MDRSRLPHILLCGLISSLFAPLAAAQHRDTRAQVLTAPYQRWLAEDVSYIITNDERSGFLKLTSDQQRDRFIEDFWERRNPDPGSGNNTFKEEHYRRLAYTNQHFAAAVAGYKTDRGRIYILYGPPDEREQHPGHHDLGTPGSAPLTALYPSDIWRYHFIPGVGNNVVFEFIDTCLCGQYRLREDPTKKRPSSRRDKNQPLPVKTFTGAVQVR